MAHVLVVDDDAAIRRMLRRQFTLAGDTILEAASGPVALDLLTAGNRPDAIVCDVLMPGISGLQFYRQLVRLFPQYRHRFVFLTGASAEPSVYQPIEDLGVPLLAKLDDLQLVIDAVRVAVLRDQD